MRNASASPLSRLQPPAYPHQVSENLKRANDLVLEDLSSSARAHPPMIELSQMYRAIEEYAPGRAVAAVEPRQGVWQRLLDSISPLAMVSAAMAIVFAACGLLKGGNAGYLDIAKIFAGAIVGSTSVSAASVLRSGRSLQQNAEVKGQATVRK
jgi:hypothetical protein